ncbi:MAG: CBS domain-containing protein, partial [Acidobacteriota bacterium]
LAGEPVRKFMVANPVTVSPGLSLDDLIEDYIYRYHFKMFPVVDEGRLLGCVTLDRVKEVPKEERGRHQVAQLAKECSEENTIGPDDDVIKALTIMKKANRSRLMVVEGHRLVGVISLKDILGFLSLKLDLEG